MSAPFTVRTSLLLLFLLLSCLFTSSLLARQALDTFTAEALVVNQSKAVRRQAVSNGLASVLIRLSGTTTLLQEPVVRSALKNASKYLYEFSYQSTDKTITILGAEQPANLLLMRFSQAPLEALLKEARLPIWSANRPDILVWAVASDGAKKTYVGTESEFGESLKSAAADRGLPILLPILDLEDRSALPESRLWAMDEDRVRSATERYFSDGVLAGRFRQEKNQWVGNFLLIHGDNSQYFSAKGDRQATVVKDIIGQVTDYFANIYAVVPSGLPLNDGILLQVNNISDFGRYQQLLTYLSSVTMVKASTLTRVSYPKLQVTLELNGTLEQLLTTFKLDRKLQQVNPGRPALPELRVNVAQTNPNQGQDTEEPSDPSDDVSPPPVLLPQKVKPPALEFNWLG